MTLTLTLRAAAAATATAAIIILIVQQPLSAAASDLEIRSLIEFKKGIKTDPLGKIFSSWNQMNSDPSTTCPSTFYGVVCDQTSSSVVAIHLDGLGLTGELKFSTLSDLKSLQNLTLSGNFFTGRVVPTFGAISSLNYLDLSGNEFYGSIPGRIYDLWGLNYLNLSRNNFTGGFPVVNSNLGQLQVLDLHGNALSGNIQDLFAVLRNVEYVDLSGNLFYGSLAMSVQNVSSLANTVQYLNLRGNKIGDGFFGEDTIGLFRNLRFLDVGDNEIIGQLPSFSGLPNLQVLRLGNNALYGEIPAQLLEGLVPLEELDLSGNGFSGSIPIMKSSTLKLLNFSSNALSGVLPPSLGNCTILDLSRNMLNGDIQVMESWGSSLETLDLSSNQLSGSIPNVTQLEKLTSINVGNNSIRGSLPNVLGPSPKLTVIDFSSNKLDGEIPNAYFVSATLVNLNLSGNHLTGSIPLEGAHAGELLILPSYPQLTYLDLSDNALTNNISSGIGNFVILKVLNLAKNKLSGHIPREMDNINGLEYLDLSVNDFTGEIPENLSSSLRFFNISHNNLQGSVPDNLRGFTDASFHPGNNLLALLGHGGFHSSDGPKEFRSIGKKHHSSKSTIRIAIIVACVGAVFMAAFVLLAYHRARLHDRNRFSSQTASRDTNQGMFPRPSILRFNTRTDPPQSSLSFSHDHLLSSMPRSSSGPVETGAETSSTSAHVNTRTQDAYPTTSGRKSSPGSPLASSPRFIDRLEQPVTLDAYSPDRLAGELFFLDPSLAFTVEELSRAPAELLGRSSHGTLYKATLHNGHKLNVKWLRIGLVKNKKEFSKEVRRIGSIQHPNLLPLRAYYWGQKEQERLIIADYIEGDSLAQHLYETTPRRYSPLSFAQRLRVSVDVARCLTYMHEKGMTHGNLKPTNILLGGSDYTVRFTDYSLHRLLTPAGVSEQMLNMGALGYRAPELTTAKKPAPTFKSDVYAFGVILMELLTRRSAGDIISGQSGAVDLTDWVRLCDEEGRGLDCIDRDIAGGEEHLRKAMDDVLTASLRCILPVSERPNIRQILEDLCSISV